MTAAEALAWASRRLREAGVEGPERDARILLAHALGVDRARLVLMLPEPVPEAARRRLEAAVAARAARQPVAQIIGERLFHGLRLKVTPDVLDPRPETETLVETALAAPFGRVLDLGTGSGAILLALLAARPEATGLGTDISEAALAVARENARRLELEQRASFRRADWWEGITGRFDLIVSNPPYIGEAEIAALAPETRDWEPRAALTPGADALAAYRAIAAGAAEHLAPQGRLIVETGAGQAEEVARIFAAAGLLDPRLVADLDGRPRVVAATAPQ
ncbi:MAG: peptide chain release factor N(5)-glutamine methyltransferase [Alphaproteobacteria bacterium]|nr:MAG: peptide chain release factor N(5)-glutamine methyltransferase [Alphaproteobacteria bacterium]